MARKDIYPDTWRKAFFGVFKPKPKLTGSEWADKYRFVAPGTTAEPGEWRTSRTPYLKEPMDVATDDDTEMVVLMCSSQVGKALALDTPLPTPEGWTTMGEVKVGDVLFDEDGEPCRVLAKTDVMHDHECYCVTFSDGSRIVADAQHEWQVETDYMPLGYTRGRNNARKAVHSGTITTAKMSEMHALVRAKTGVRNNFAIPVCGALKTHEASLPVKPYTLGVWLGDGHAYSNQFCGHFDDISIVENVRADGYRVEVRNEADHLYNAIIEPVDRSFCSHGHELDIVGRTKAGYCLECARTHARNAARRKRGIAASDELPPKSKTFYSTLKELGLIGDKAIPSAYLRASESQRWALLQGLMDTDGACGKRGLCEITLKSKKLFDGVVELLLSLGLKPAIHSKQAACGSYSCEVWRATFTAYSDQPVFRLERKQARLRSREGRRVTETTRRRVISVDRVSSVPVQCIAVDSPSHLYLAGQSMIPTHNSECLLNVLGYYMEQQPAPILMLQPTLGMAAAFSKERIDPTIRWSKALCELMPRAKEDGRGSSRKSGDTIFMKTFPGGYMALVGANSPAGLASRPIRVLLADEVDRYTETKEGKPLALAIQRTTNFHNRKIVMVSTPTIRGVSEIERWFDKSDKRRFHIPCPHCGEYSVWTWDMVKWDKDENGELIPESICMRCPTCGQKLRGPGRPDPKLIEQGVWIASSESKIKGFHVNSLVSPWVSLDALVDEFRTAIHRKDRSGLQEFVNLKLGESFELEDYEEDIYSKLIHRREAYGNVLHEGVLVVTAGVDVQHDRIECTLIGWGANQESWILYHHILHGDPREKDVWSRLDEVLMQRFEHPFIGELHVACTCIDSGDGTMSEIVYEFARAREMRCVYAIKGRGGFEVPFVSRPQRNNRFKALLFNLGVDSGKSIVMARLGNSEKGAGFVHIPREAARGCDDEYCAQLTAERLSTEMKDGRVVCKWRKVRERNEALDCAVYATAALEIIHPDLDAMQNYYDAGGQPQSQTQRKRVISRGVSL